MFDKEHDSIAYMETSLVYQRDSGQMERWKMGIPFLNLWFARRLSSPEAEWANGCEIQSYSQQLDSLCTILFKKDRKSLKVLEKEIEMMS